ncbi:MAG: hypothetical protein ACTSRL_22740 [Candidatus Helarchaeota archaeon]
MEKWQRYTCFILVGSGITYLLLGITNGIHNLFNLEGINTAFIGGLALIGGSVIFYLYLFRKPTTKLTYHSGMSLGLFLIIGCFVYSLLKLSDSLKLLEDPISSYYFTGSLLLISLTLFLGWSIGIIIISEALRQKKRLSE